MATQTAINKLTRQQEIKLADEKWVAENQINIGDVFRDLTAGLNSYFIKVISVSKCQVKCQTILPMRMNERHDDLYEYWEVSPSNPKNKMGEVISKKKAYFRHLRKCDDTTIFNNDRYLHN